MDIFLDNDGVCFEFRHVQKLLGRRALFCKGDAPSAQETKEEQAFAEIAGKKWKYYEDNVRPLEQAYFNDVNDLNTDGARDFASGVAGSSTAAQFDNARKQAAESLNSAGINPASGRYQATMSGLSDYQGAATTENKTMAENSVDDQYIGGMQNISAIGRGQSTTTQAGMGDLALSAANKARSDAYSAFNNRAGTVNAVGAIGGLAAYRYGGSAGDSDKPSSEVEK
jgi:hypothetical protein